MQTVSQFIDAIGQESILAELDVSERNLRHARHVGYFAAGWFLPMRRLAERHGVHCPEHLFNWKSIERGGATANNQGDGPRLSPEGGAE